MLYFDNHATTRLDPRVLDAMMPYLTEAYGNAESAQHAFGWKAHAAVEKARAQVANLIGAAASEIIFTSGATESIHLAILGYLEALGAPQHIVTSNVEHKATLEVLAKARALGHSVTILEADRFGQVSPTKVIESLQPNTALVSLIHGNNEIGTMNPIQAIGEALHEANPNIVFHVDAAQSAGKHDLDVKLFRVDLLSLSAHKLYGPKGIGALYVQRNPRKVHLYPYLVGGGQERSLRSGTHNVPGIVGLGECSEIAQQEMQDEQKKLIKWRDRIIHFAMTEIKGVELNGHPVERLCNNVNLTIHGMQPDDLLIELKDIAYSSTSACSTGSVSHVLQAIGQVTTDPLKTTVRFGLGRFTTESEIQVLIDRLAQALSKRSEKYQ
jgi:cysteine desulfurase